MPWKPTADTGTTKAVAIHAALVVTPSGPRIVYFGWGSEKTFLYDATPGVTDVDRTTVTGGNPVTSQDLGHMFCGSESFLADGRLFVGGGVVNQNLDHGAFAHDSGERRCYIYSPIANTWTGEGVIDDLSFQPGSNERGGGRWYPTLLTLGNGEPFAIGGHPFIGFGANNQPNADNSPWPAASGTPRHNNNTPERYTLTSNAWTLLTNESTAHDDHDIDEYPRVHLAPSGHVFFSTWAKGNKRFFNAFTGAYTGDEVAPGHGDYLSGSESTAVMLPILPNDLGNIWVLALGGSQAQKINIADDATPVWENTGTGTKPVRNHASAVLLPTGQVFLTGGVGSDGVGANPADPSVTPKRATSFLTPEMYTPPINNAFTAYTGGAGTWANLPAATVTRGYHGSALLLPDGRVWTAGSTDGAGATQMTQVFANGNPVTYPNGDPVLDFQGFDEQRIEIFEPTYFAVPNRTLISNVPESVGYGMDLVFDVTSGVPARIVLMRCGSMTHAFDSDQRYVVLSFNRESTTVTAAVPTNPNILPPGMYMLWVIDGNGNPSRAAKFVRVCDQHVRFDVNRSTFSKDETTAKQQNGVTRFPEILHAHFECFRPSELSHPTPPQTRLRWDNTSGATIDASLMELELERTIFEDPSVPPDVAQRITFVYNLVIKDLALFEQLGNTTDREFNARVRIDRFFADTRLGLTTDPNPYMVDVQSDNPHYLSSDLRVFKIRPGQTKFGGISFGQSDTPLQFIQSLLATMNGDAAVGAQRFGALPTQQDDVDGVMELSQFVGGQMVGGMVFGGEPVFNFAIAKVRYVSQSTTINNVKVFFRLFNTVGTMLDYNSQTTYRREGSGADTIPLLGRFGPIIISIPCFATARFTPLIPMQDQTDSHNTRTITPNGSDESVEYFGCWLDINQTTDHIPPMPLNDGPYLQGLLFPFNPVSIQELVRNHHQCLVAELFFEPDKIPDASDPQNTAPPGTPANHENLAQRNLAISKSGNPGSPASRTVQTTFAVKASLGATSKYEQPYVSPDRRMPFDLRRRRAPWPDELMLFSKDLPAGSMVTIYSPDLDAAAILRLAARRTSPVVFTKLDAHTVRFELKQAAYVPLPGGLLRNVAGLLSVELPAGVTQGQVYTLEAHQYSGQSPRRLIGSFMLRIPVEAEDSLLLEEVRKLSVLRHIFASIHTNDPWHAVFVRYLGEIENRVRAFGGDPDRVVPSPSGSLPEPEPGDDRDVIEGKVSRVMFDCFGDFKGFELETCRERRVFASCEKKVEELVLRACKERWTLRIAVRDDRKIAAISVVCC